MPDLNDGETAEVQGSGSSVYELKNSGGVYSCTCPAWRNQSLGIEKRTCKHLRAYRGDAAETERLGAAALTGKPPRPPRAPGEPAADDDDEGPPVLLAHKWEVDNDITGWWMSEKLDGVRAYWDGKQFLSRLGNKFYPPAWFVEGLPDHPLDGELWGGRKKFQRTVGIVKRQDESPLWKELLYVVFDAPAHEGAFEDRIEHVKKAVEGKAPYVRVHEHWVCKGTAHLKEELARVEALGGEGLMARKPRSKYEAGRSNTLLKVKTFKDAEARVIGHAAGAGRHKGRLGAVIVELANGTRFNVGTGFSDVERENPPPLGSIITFRYQELSDGGVPRFPSYVGVRIDANKPSTLDSPRELPPSPRELPPPRRELPPPPRESYRGSASSNHANEEAPSLARGLGGVLASEGGSRGVRRFEMEEDGTRYFWEIDAGADNKHRVRFGTFQAKVKSFDSAEECQQALLSRVREKLENGFVEVDD